MKVRRIVEIEDVNIFEVGDQIDVGKYTATAMKQDGDYMIFCLDQYLDKLYTHENLIEKINWDIIHDSNFNGILHLVDFDQGFRIPYAGEFFMGTSEEEWVCENIEPDHNGEFYEVWPAMKDRWNRIAFHEENKHQWGWLMNESKVSADFFAVVDCGYAPYDNASDTISGVRPVFRIRNR